MVERSSVPSVAFQPFEFIFLCQGLRGYSLYFGAMGEMIQHSTSYPMLFSHKSKSLCLNGRFVPPGPGLSPVSLNVLSLFLYHNA